MKDIKLANAVNKLELVGTSNNGYRHRYSCVKDESFKNAFIKFLGALDFKEDEIKEIFVRYGEHDEHIEIKIKDLLDNCMHFQNKRYDIDVFYGIKKVIILVRVKGREELVEEVIKNSKWKKFIEVSPKNLGTSISDKQKIIPKMIVNKTKNIKSK